MIIKTTTGKSFSGCVNYNYSKVEMNKGEVLGSRGISDENDRKQIVKDLNTQADCYKSSKLSHKVIHTSLNFSVDDKPVNNAEMKKIAEDYINRRGLDNTQYVIIRHNDASHQHCHIIANRVMDNNKLYDLRFNRQRDYEVARALEKKYDLVVATDIKQQDIKVNVERLRPKEHLKHDVKANLENCLKNSKNIDEFTQKLKEYNINFSYTYSNQRENKIVGCTFERDGFSISAGSIKQSDLHKKIQERFKENAINNLVQKNQSYSEQMPEFVKLQIRYGVDSIMHQCKSMEDFKEKLSNTAYGKITANIVNNSEGNPIGIKFQKDNLKINGSKIGAGYSYGSILYKLNANAKKEQLQNRENKNAVAKENIPKEINQWERLQEKSFVQTAVNSVITNCKNMQDLKKQLETGVSGDMFKTKVGFYYDKETKQIKGISFERNGQVFKGSELGKEYSFNALKNKIESVKNFKQKNQSQGLSIQY